MNRKKRINDKLKKNLKDFQILILSNGSTKENISILSDKKFKNPKIDVVFLDQKGKGFGNALIHGINICKTKYFCIFNADGSFNPKEISAMLNKLVVENLDVVFASRYQKDSGSEDDTLVTLVGNFFFTALGKILFSLPITDILYTFVIGKTNKINDLKLSQNDFSFCVELPIKAQKNKLKIASISAHERSRIAGKKKVNAFKDGFLILIHMIKLFFSK